ncbi:MAG: prepilin-type N-terminal cleavage/methylation domain-containing protein [Candidatus Eremiobacteraeota bacterium]|nr:prepilin-type N-terminal cleavage/methylation domain-containing protein [Candidatus Eremiobacteraeota bacterium]
MKKRGTTLIELLVVMAVWSFILVAVLSFYIYGTKVNRRYDQMSQELRAVQQVADKFNQVLSHAVLLEVIQFPPSVIFTREEEVFPALPGCLLPNIKAQTEFIGIAPDTKRVGATADPRTCKDNAIYLGTLGQRGQVIMQLPHGLIAEARILKGGPLLMLSFNSPSRSQPEIIPASEQPGQLENADTASWKPLNHYFQYRGLTGATRYTGLE